MDKNKVSIITPAYNSEESLTATYHSIKAQTHQNWEWLITDDCSTDATLEILHQLAEQDERIRFFKNEINSGAAVSRNNSLKNATGDYISFIDSDDVWLPNKLSSQIAFMENNPHVNFSFTAYSIIDQSGNPLNKVVDMQGEAKSFSYQDMLKKYATLGCSTVMLRAAAFPNISMPLLRTGQDYALWLKILKTGEKAHLISEILTLYRIMPNSISRNKFKKARRQWKIYREIESLNLFKSAYVFFFYAYHAVFRN